MPQHPTGLTGPALQKKRQSTKCRLRSLGPAALAAMAYCLWLWPWLWHGRGCSHGMGGALTQLWDL